MSVKIIVDSACDMTKKEAEEKNLIFLPLKTRIEDKEYLDGIDITHEEFFEKLKNCATLPTTSQLNPHEFSEAYKEALADGSELVVITLSSKLSGTYQSAMAAADEYENRVFVVDSENVTIGEHILVEYAIQLRAAGLSAADIASKLDLAKKHICVIGLVDTLEYLVKGGRLSKTAGFAGSILNIKPVLCVSEGELVVLGKARGSKQSNNFLNETIKAKGGFNFNMPFMLAYSGSDDSLLQNYIENSRSIWEGNTDTLPISTIGSTIGTHVGPGLVGVAFFAPSFSA